jgi:hypothetical protein
LGKLLEAYPSVVVPKNLMEGLTLVSQGHGANLAEAHAMAETGTGEIKLFANKVDVEACATDGSWTETCGYHCT